jgi:hypothetical protein
VYRAADGTVHHGREAIARLVEGGGVRVEMVGEVNVREREGGALAVFDWAMPAAARAGRITCHVVPVAGGVSIQRLENQARPAQNT